MSKRNFKKTLKKSLAIISSLTLLMSCFSAELITTASADGVVKANVMRVYDEYGNELADNEQIYIDNSTAAGQPEETTIRVTIENSSATSSTPLYDSVSGDVPATENPSCLLGGVYLINSDTKTKTYEIPVYGYSTTPATWQDPVTNEQIQYDKHVPLTPGQTELRLYNEDGKAVKNLKIVTLEPATDIHLYYDTVDVKVNDWCFSNYAQAASTVAGKKKRFTYKLDTAHPQADAAYLDTVEWDVFNLDDYNNPIPHENVAEDDVRAQIAPDGILTGLKNGSVMVTATFKQTAGAVSRYNAKKKAYDNQNFKDLNFNGIKDENEPLYVSEEPVMESDRRYAIGPKEYGFRAPVIDGESGEIDVSQYQKNSDGTPRIVTVSGDNKMPVFSNYNIATVTSGTDRGKKYITGTMQLRNNTSVQYQDIITMPKRVKSVILKANPAKKVEFDNSNKVFTDFENLRIAMNPGGQAKKLNIKATPTYTFESEAEALQQGFPGTGVTDDWVWSSSNSDVVSVDKSGNITPKAKGTAQITVKSDDQANISATCTVVVTTLATSLYIVDMDVDQSVQSISTRIGVGKKVKAVLNPTESNERVQWVSDNPNVATVSPEISGGEDNTAYATITGVSEGGTKVWAITEDSKTKTPVEVTVGIKNATQKMEVSTQIDNERFVFTDVNNPPANQEDVRDTHILYTTQDMTIDVDLLSNNGVFSDDSVTWTISDPDKHITEVSRDSTGKHLTIRGMTEGEATLTAASTDFPAIKQTFKIKVLRKADSIKITRSGGAALSSTNFYVCRGNTIDLDAVLKSNDPNFPERHSDRIIKWYTSAENVAAFDTESPDVDAKYYAKRDKKELVAALDNTGMVASDSFPCYLQALSLGKAVIDVYTASGVKDRITVNVIEASEVVFTNVDRNKETGELYKRVDMTAESGNKVSGKATLSINVKDSSGETKEPVECEWTTSDPKVAEVTSFSSNSATITANGVGKATITVNAGGRKAECVIYAYAPMSALSTNELQNFIYTPTKSTYPQDISSLKPTINGVVLKENEDFTVSYKDYDKVDSTAYVTFEGKGYYTGSTSKSYQISKRSLTSEGIEIKYDTTQKCNGEDIKPDVTVICDGITLTENTDYTVSCSNNRLPGTAKMTISGTYSGKYSDSVEKEFVIKCDHDVLVNAQTITDATYETDGEEVGKCAACGEENVHKVIPKFNHTSNPATTISFKKPSDYGADQLACFGVGYSQERDISEFLIAVTKDKTKPATDTFRWKSEDPTVVSVTNEGVIKGIAYVGDNKTTTITVYGESATAVATCEVKVVNMVSELVPTEETVETREGVTMQTRVTVDPSDFTDTIEWVSADESIAKVEPSKDASTIGLVTGVSVGSTTIKARGKYSGVETEIKVNVGKRIPSDSIHISTTIKDVPTNIPNSTADSMFTYRMYSTQDVTFDSFITNSAGIPSDDTAVWQITDNKGDTVTIPDDVLKENPEMDLKKDIVANSVKLHGASLGTATVTVFPQSKPELKTSFKIEVAKRCDNIKLLDEYGSEVSSRSLNVDDTVSIYPDLTTNDPNHPYDHGDLSLTCVSDNEEIATVKELFDEKGAAYYVVTAKKNGSTTLTYYTRSEQTKTVSLTVFTTSNIYLTGGVEKPENPGDLPTASIKVNDTFEGSTSLTASVYDQNESSVSNTICKWTSSDESIATVNEKGTVKAVNVGKVIITAQSGAKKESCEVTITAPMSAISYDPIEDYLYDPTVKEYKPDVVLKMGPTTLVKDVDYTEEFSNNTGIGTAYIKFTSLNEYYLDSTSISFSIKRRPIDNEEVKIAAIPNQNWTGESITPELDITCKGVKLEQGTDYSVSFADNVEKGMATVTITGNNNYEGTKTMNFVIEKNFIGTMGDIDNDKSVTASDALLILRASLGMDEFTKDQEKLADVNKDNAVDATDSLLVLRFSVGFTDPDVYINTLCPAG